MSCISSQVLRVYFSRKAVPNASGRNAGLKPRDRTFKLKEGNKKDGKQYTVNRTEGRAVLGGAGLDNEECYLRSKIARSKGLIFVEHHARL